MSRDITQHRLIISELPKTERKLVITQMIRTMFATDLFLAVADDIRECKQLHRGVAKRYLRECCEVCEHAKEWIKATTMHSAEWEAICDATESLKKEICGKSKYHVNLLKQLRDSLIDFSDNSHPEAIKTIMSRFGAANDIMNFVIVINALDIHDYHKIDYMALMGGNIVFKIPRAQRSHSATALAKFVKIVERLSEEICRNANITQARRDMVYCHEVLDKLTRLLAGNECNIVQHYDNAIKDNANEDYYRTINLEKRRRFLREQKKTADKRKKFLDVLEKSLNERDWGPRKGEGIEAYKLRVLGSAKEVHKFNLSSQALKRAEGLTDLQQLELDLQLLKDAELKGITTLYEDDKSKIEANPNFLKICEHYYLKDIPPLTPRTLRILDGLGITTVADIVTREVADIKALKGIGPKTWENIVQALNYLDININKDND